MKISKILLYFLFCYFNDNNYLCALKSEELYYGGRNVPYFYIIFMINTEKIKKIIADWIEDKDIFFVALSIGSGNTIKVLLDKPEGITIDECVLISRMIEAKLNRDEEDYELQVSSPGLGMPFKVIEQYYKNIGNKIEVITLDGLKNKGILNKVTDKGIELGIETRVKKEKKKKVIHKNISIDYNQITTAKTVIAFK